MFKTCLLVVLVGFVALAIARAPLRPPSEPPELHLTYASFAGRIERAPAAPTAVGLITPAGEVTLVPNRFEALVGELGGREVVVEGLLLSMGGSVLLWVEVIHWDGAPADPERSPVRSRIREIPI